jgi:hypothetical protein
VIVSNMKMREAVFFYRLHVNFISVFLLFEMVVTLGLLHEEFIFQNWL